MLVFLYFFQFNIAKDIKIRYNNKDSNMLLFTYERGAKLNEIIEIFNAYTS